MRNGSSEYPSVRCLILFASCVLVGLSSCRLLQCELSILCHKFVKNTHAFIQNGCFNGKHGAGELVIVRCPFREVRLEKLHGWGAFEDVRSSSWGLRLESTMLQCVEACTPSDGCEYSKLWQATAVDSSLFRDRARALKECGADNPPWPPFERVPEAGEEHASMQHLRVGGFQVGEELDKAVKFTELALTDPLNDGVPPPKGWTKKPNEFGDEGYAFSNNASTQRGTDIGTVHVKLFKESPKVVPNVFMIGLNNNGTIEKWYAPWPCSYDVMNWQYGAVEFACIDKDSSYFLDRTAPESRMKSWIIFLMLSWLGWSGCACSAGKIPGFLPHDRREDTLDLYVCMGLSGSIPAILCLFLIVEAMDWIIPQPKVGLLILFGTALLACGLAAITVEPPFQVLLLAGRRVEESSRSLLPRAEHRTELSQR
mmetsp:Transcript_3629/g.9165  ORF Transcript_3629/g.9165 Transcript_3629/m.9165 type:complete len:426 (-) Transcript_3629:73-1350(-)